MTAVINLAGAIMLVVGGFMMGLTYASAKFRRSLTKILELDVRHFNELMDLVEKWNEQDAKQ